MERIENHMVVGPDEFDEVIPFDCPVCGELTDTVGNYEGYCGIICYEEGMEEEKRLIEKYEEMMEEREDEYE
tara:strand:- start:592 stop:807 length:216 start_codon:yes stop_codon:yes gene_type:complete